MNDQIEKRGYLLEDFRLFHLGGAPSSDIDLHYHEFHKIFILISGSGGYTVEIDHQDGYSSKYLHQTHYIVSAGQYVSAGQVIGYVGSTGTSTGPHLHFSILYNGEHVNPANYIRI